MSVEKKTDEKRIAEHCILSPPDLTEETKQKWISCVFALLQRRANEGQTDFTLDLTYFLGGSFDHKDQRMSRSKGFMHRDLAGSGGLNVSDKNDLISLMELIPELFSWAAECYFRIGQLSDVFPVRRTDPFQLKLPPHDVVRHARLIFDRKMSDIQRALTEYWVAHSDIPVKCLTKEDGIGNYSGQAFSLHFDWLVLENNKRDEGQQLGERFEDREVRRVRSQKRVKLTIKK
jgi:hypothetical protein